MDLQQAINHPKVNVFDIFNNKSHYGFSVFTYRKPGESWDDWGDRDSRNFQKALELKRSANNTDPLLKF